MIDNGRAQLDAVRDRLAQILKQQRGDYSHALAEHWQGQPVKRAATLQLAAARGRRRRSPRCCSSASTGRCRRRSAARSDPVFGEIQGLRLTPPVVADAAARAEAAPRAVPAARHQGRTWSRVQRRDRSQRRHDPRRRHVRDRQRDAAARARGADGHASPTRWRWSPATCSSPATPTTSRSRAAPASRRTGTCRTSARATCATCWSRARCRRRPHPRRRPRRRRAGGRRTTPPANRALNRRVEVTLFVGRGAEASASRPQGK